MEGGFVHQTSMAWHRMGLSLVRTEGCGRPREWRCQHLGPRSRLDPSRDRAVPVVPIARKSGLSCFT